MKLTAEEMKIIADQDRANLVFKALLWAMALAWIVLSIVIAIQQREADGRSTASQLTHSNCTTEERTIETDTDGMFSRPKVTTERITTCRL